MWKSLPVLVLFAFVRAQTCGANTGDNCNICPACPVCPTCSSYSDPAAANFRTVYEGSIPAPVTAVTPYSGTACPACPAGCPVCAPCVNCAVWCDSSHTTSCQSTDSSWDLLMEIRPRQLDITSALNAIASQLATVMGVPASRIVQQKQDSMPGEQVFMQLFFRDTTAEQVSSATAAVRSKFASGELADSMRTATGVQNLLIVQLATSTAVDTFYRYPSLAESISPTNDVNRLTFLLSHPDPNFYASHFSAVISTLSAALGLPSTNFQLAIILAYSVVVYRVTEDTTPTNWNAFASFMAAIKDFSFVNSLLSETKFRRISLAGQAAVQAPMLLCPNNCTNAYDEYHGVYHGVCLGTGVCQCDPGFFGPDCCDSGCGEQVITTPSPTVFENAPSYVPTPTFAADATRSAIIIVTIDDRDLTFTEAGFIKSLANSLNVSSSVIFVENVEVVRVDGFFAAEVDFIIQSSSASLLNETVTNVLQNSKNINFGGTVLSGPSYASGVVTRVGDLITYKSSLLEGRASPLAVAVGSTVVVLGGNDGTATATAGGGLQLSGFIGTTISANVGQQSYSWRYIPTFVINTDSVALATYRGYIFAFGADLVRGRVYSLDPITPNSQWQERQRQPDSRAYMSAVVVQAQGTDLILLIGGFDGNGTAVNFVSSYAPLSATFSTRTPMPKARGRVQSAVAQNIVYVLGGTTTSGSASGLSDVDSFNPETGVWMALAPLPFTNTVGFAAAFSFTQLYVFGGVSTGSSGQLQFSNGVFQYDTVSDKWTKRNYTLPKAIAYQAAVNLPLNPAHILLLGGATAGRIDAPSSDARLYAAESSAWLFDASAIWDRSLTPAPTVSSADGAKPALERNTTTANTAASLCRCDRVVFVVASLTVLLWFV